MSSIIATPSSSLSPQQIQELELVLSKFYGGGNGTVSNDERRNMEKWLNDRFGGINAWQTGLYLLTVNNNYATASSFYLNWFGLYLIENCIKSPTVWDHVSLEDKNRLKDTFFSLLMNYKVMNQSLWTKICTIIVGVAKLEWPEKWPAFLPRVMSLCSTEDTIVVGLTLLTSISEEFTTDRADIPAARRSQLRNHLTLEVGKILDFLKNVLDSFWSQKQSGNNKAHVSNITVLSMKCIAQFLSWIPYENNLKVSLLNTLTMYATTQTSDAVHALNCFTEIMNKQQVSTGTEPLMMECFKYMLNIVNNFVTNYPSMSAAEDADVEYLEKLSLLQHFFISNHLRRMESNNAFPVMQFLLLFYKFTFIQPTTEQFLFCLDSLSVFLDFLQNEKHVRDESSFKNLVHKYQDALVAFSSGVMKRGQFAEMGDNYLFDLDNEKMDQDGQTELDQYLDQCIEVIGITGELYFERVITQIHATFFKLSNQFTRMNKIAVVHTLDDMSSEEKSVFSVCRDLITCLRIYGRLSNKFVQTFDQTVQPCMQFLHENLQLAKLCLSNSLHNQAKIYSKLIEEIFDALQMFHPWIKELSSRNEARIEFEKLMTVIFDCLLRSLDPTTNATIDVLNGSTGLLLSIFYNFGNLPLTDLKPYTLIVQNLSPLTQHIASKFSQEESGPVLKRFYAAISNSILLKQAASNIPNLVEWQKEKYQQFTQAYLGSQYQQVLVLLQQNQFANPMVLNTLPVILSLAQSIVDSVHDKSKIVKTIVYDNLKFLIDSLLNLFRVYIDTPRILNLLLGLMLSIFNSLVAQVGLDYIQQTVESFLSLFTRDAIQKFSSDPSGRPVLVNFLELLTALMSEGSSRFLPLTGKIIAICKDMIYPVILPSDLIISYSSAKISIDVLSKYFNLLYMILHSNWKYFFNMQQQPTSQESMLQFSFILECFLQSFKLPDVQLFKENLKLLEELNVSRKLYQRPVFVNQMMFPFSKQLFDVLLAKTHALIQEEIITVAFNMAQANWTAFEQQFLPNYLSSVKSEGSSTGLNEQQVGTLRQYLTTGGTDTQSNNSIKFAQNMSRFLNDVRYCLSSSAVH